MMHIVDNLKKYAKQFFCYKNIILWIIHKPQSDVRERERNVSTVQKIIVLYIFFKENLNDFITNR